MQEHLLKQLRKSGFRLTKARTEMVAVFAQTVSPISAAELQAKMKTMPNKSTVYRELTFLVTQGVLVEVHVNRETRHYELANQSHHHHLVCDRCEIIEDIVLHDDLRTFEAEIVKGKRFKVNRHSLEFFGLCYKCQIAT